VKKRILDTDILSFLIKGEAVALKRAKEYLQVYPKLTFSIITYYEIKRGLLYRDARRQLPMFERLAAKSEVIPLNVEIADIAASLYAQLRAKGRIVADADLLLAATAIALDAVFVTNNESHYEHIPGLVLENWMKP